ncbi:B3/B4 domain-containing protein [Anaerophaga thermohalophila]|jgi:DNA/RNA-binding domain of Phe-tRNA-synthetase-like protein|uniref:B3/B4 domain-containing protein n=1 Tax=Anaerophaga thermohalophila TaxID=177400 RepID=UPI0002D45E00|nr:phenylalanine--tRNA ligase beta subunit-related protein [Anaerophaga thermohalophila]
MSLPQIEIQTLLRNKLPNLKLGILYSPVLVTPSDENLVSGLDEQTEQLVGLLDVETIRNMETVKSAKNAYRALGKDPNRYRPAAESLLRRVSKGKGLYHVNSVVDCLNLASVRTGYSICGYDFDKIEGEVSLGIGNAGEPYEGIGRGELNIENLPVFRDDKGAFGTPTSDSVRTLIDENTERVLMIIPAFDGDRESLKAALNLLSDLLIKYVKGTSPEFQIK